jgi:hypothetical protein
MDKKKSMSEDNKGFEEFIDGLAKNEATSEPPQKRDNSFDHLTSLENDSKRLFKIKEMIVEKIPFEAKHAQAEKLISQQLEEKNALKFKLSEILNKPNSSYQKSLKEIFDNFF